MPNLFQIGDDRFDADILVKKIEVGVCPEIRLSLDEIEWSSNEVHHHPNFKHNNKYIIVTKRNGKMVLISGIKKPGINIYLVSGPVLKTARTHHEKDIFFQPKITQHLAPSDKDDVSWQQNARNYNKR